MPVERYSIAEAQRTNQPTLSWVGVSSLSRGARDGRTQKFRRSSDQARFAVSRENGKPAAALRERHSLGRTDWLASEKSLSSNALISAGAAAPVTYFSGVSDPGAVPAFTARALEPVVPPSLAPAASFDAGAAAGGMVQSSAAATLFPGTAGAIVSGANLEAMPAPSASQSPSPVAEPPAKILQTSASQTSVSASEGDPAQAASMLDWRTSWLNAAALTPCGSCTGRACTMCSVRTGGPTASNGQPTGYSARVLDLYKPEENVTSDASMGLARATTASLMNPDAAPNAIVLENMKQGTPESVWLINAHDPTIEGFADQFSLNRGETVDFKINTNSTDYTVDIYRIGYYNGDGARLIDTIERDLTTAQSQPLPIFDPETKLVDAGNWSVTTSWAVPEDAVSGIYFAKLTRHDGSMGENMIPFIVRNDDEPSDITFQTADTTWQAYNWWGGYNFYGGVDGGLRTGRASKVSYNRPIITRDGGFAAGPQDYIFGAEYPAIRFLEQNGYDINYISGIDSAADAAQLLNSKIFLSVGHDEYWSGEQRDNVEAARDAGVNLSFWSGNEVYWQTRWETSIDGTGTPYKTLVSYKERWDNRDSDPDGTTSTWRDPVLGSGRPENALTGTMFTVDSYRLDAIDVPYDMSNLRFWRNTDVANINPGEVYTLTKNLLGYEWDSDVDNGFRPAGLVPLSSTTVDVNTLLLDYGTSTGPGTADHSLTLYRAPSGALVFGAGTVYWSWGLDSNHDLERTPTDPNVQQAMINLFADMGVQPATLMQSLVAASQTTDNVAPTTTINALSEPLEAAKTVTITGTATDTGGGLVSVVEVSTNGGQSWHRATGGDTWSYSWTPLVAGAYTIMSRAVDDSINLETPGAGRTVTVEQGGSGTLFAPGETPSTPFVLDNRAVNLGVTFSSNQSGSIMGVRYFKGTGNSGEHIGSLWTSTGELLARATFRNETPSGWQTVIFDNPVSITAGTTYVASSYGIGYAASTDYFTSPQTRGPLTSTGGLYSYGGASALPTTSSTSNYWVDVVFSGVPTPNAPPVGNNDDGYLVQRDTPITFAMSTLLANDTDPNNDELTVIGAGSASNGTVTFNAAAQTLTFTPNAGYTGPASFGYSISDGRGGTGASMVNMTVSSAVSTSSLFQPSDTPTNLSNSDPAQVNLGVKFVASAGGLINGIKYYKSALDTGTHTGSLWSSSGTLLATATFVNETASGWQTVMFSNPVPIAAGQTYVASYHSNGRYATTSNYFNTSHTSGLLTAPAGANGVFSYGPANAMPTNSFGATNYWVDVIMTSTETSANRAPVATNDTGFTTSQNTALTLSATTLLANDNDPDSDPLSITGVSNPVNGTAVYNAQTNSVVFTPTAGYSGAASFSYAISDGRGGTASATVGLTVAAGANRPPVATNDTGLSVRRNEATQISAATLLANDTDPDGDPLTITGVSGATNGTVAFNAATNVITFTPTTGYTGAASFTYAVADGRGGTASANVGLTVAAGVTGTNLFAANATPATTTVNENLPVELGMRFSVANAGVINGIRFYKGPQNTGTHTGSLWTSTGTRLGTVTFTNETASGWQSASFASPIAVTAGTSYVVSYHTTSGYYSASGGAFTAPISNGGITAPQSTSGTGNGNGLFAYGAGGVMPTNAWNATNYFVDVYYEPSANSAPVATADTGIAVQPNTPLQIQAATLLANDTDANGDTLVITGVSGATNGTVAYNAQTQVVTFTPTTGYSGAASFTYAISDGRGGVASANVGLTVAAAANRVPIATNDTGYTTAQNTALTLAAATLLANDTDPDSDPLSITGVSNPVNGTAVYNAQTNSVVFTPTAGYSGAASFSYAISDGRGGTASATVGLTVAAGANRPPVATNDTGLSVRRNEATQISAATLLANDTDPDGDPLTITGVSGATNGTVAFNAATNVITFTPTTGYTGAASFTYAVADGRGGTASANVGLTVAAGVTGTNLFAANATPATTTVNENLPVELGMRFSVANAGVINGIRFYKGPQNTGTHTGSLWTSTGTRLGTVTFTNETASGWQSASFASPIAVTAGTSYVVSYHTTSGYYSASGGAFTAPISNGGITAPQSTSGTGNGNGLFAYGAGGVMPTNAWNATNYFVDVYYEPSANSAPVATADTGIAVQPNTPLQIQAATLLANDTDANGDTLVITGVSGATNGTVAYNAQTQVVTFTPTTGYSGAASFTYAISDGRGGVASANVGLTVAAAPVVPSGISIFAANSTPATVSVNDPNGVNLGMKFTSSENGFITGAKFYKGPTNTGPHEATLWSATGTNLGQVAFTNETASGWQTASFATPIAITAGTTYVISYHTNGNYSVTGRGLVESVTSGPLTAPSSTSSGGNGLYGYGTASAFPTSSYNSANYHVDVVFNAQLAS
ncbi:MAG: DUF4082 domain-containing protein [Devosia sp.]|uniref:DUF4082 domain-containing protein n=1 Tax=Devosia sp. TaxID=1871048 RepID=UPI001A0576FC|nr:DUF4082 domain-containing protein [Devosia sp.]MBF0677746.1 DUF4082 domain-containing protein [Devosia sp.]